MKSSFAVNHAAPLANLESHAHAKAVNAPRHAEVRIIGIEQVRDTRIDRSILRDVLFDHQIPKTVVLLASNFFTRKAMFDTTLQSIPRLLLRRIDCHITHDTIVCLYGISLSRNPGGIASDNSPRCNTVADIKIVSCVITPEGCAPAVLAIIIVQIGR